MKITTDQYDIAALSSRRVLANFMRWKAFPFGYLGKGPGIVWLLSIILRHRFGKLIATLQIKHRQRLAPIMRTIHKLRRMLRRRPE